MFPNSKFRIPNSEFYIGFLLVIAMFSSTLEAQTLDRESELQFVAPNLPAENRREMAAYHSLCDALAEEFLVALIPQDTVGLTLTGHPSFFFYLPAARKAETLTVEFFLEDENRNEIYFTKLKIPSQKGIFRFSLPPEMSPLEVDKSYRWAFAIACVPDNPIDLRDRLVSGTIRRIEPSPALLEELSKTPRERHPDLYAGAGIWHETLTTLADLSCADPNNSQIRNVWDSLLASVGLENIPKPTCIGNRELRIGN